MTYNEIIKCAEGVAEDMFNDKSVRIIKQELANQKFSEQDINAVIKSAMFMIGEKFKPSIRAKLLAGEPIQKAKEYEKVDGMTLGKLVEQEIHVIAFDEERKVKEMLRNKAKDKDIYAAIRQDFYPKENIAHQIAIHYEVKSRNSGGTRMLKILGGVGLMLLGIGLSYISSNKGSGGGRIFYGLVFVGLYMVIKGVQTVENPY